MEKREGEGEWVCMKEREEREKKESKRDKK
jgi:hypothetical protein